MGFSYAALVMETSVDEATGMVGVDKVWVALDCGRAINPLAVMGQIEGSVWMGLGQALCEETRYLDGLAAHASFLDYRMPTALDLPMIDTVLVEVANPGHPYGVRGVGEVPIVPPAAALANAIYQATGVRMTELPMSPARITAALLAAAVPA